MDGLVALMVIIAFLLLGGSNFFTMRLLDKLLSDNKELRKQAHRPVADSSSTEQPDSSKTTL